ncbi:MAG: complex I NDUFA9 subunit family protein, partial [Gammaproteobacteria bacterium]
MKKTISILGGSGFVGSHLVAELGRQGYRVRIASRHPERHRDLCVVPNVTVHACNILSYELNDFLSGSDIVINLIGVLNEERKGDFVRFNTDFPASVAQACQTLGIYRMIHMSALGADAGFAPSAYLRSKGNGEANLQRYSGEIDVTIFRPNVIFGPGDHFFNRLACLLKKIPFSFPLVSPHTRMAPVYVGDVCQAIAHSLNDRQCIGKSFELCGPKIYQFRELVEYT